MNKDYIEQREATTPTHDMVVKVRAFVTRYVVLPGQEYGDIVALWIMHTHTIEAADTSPRLVAKSAEKESGKTRLLEVLEQLVPSPLATINATTAAIFRLLHDEQTTLLFDEVDAIFNPKSAKDNEDLRALLNAGYRRGATVARVVGEGKKMKVERFPVFAATALAAIGDMPDTIESRAIIVPMRRRAPDEAVESFRRRQVLQPATWLRDQLDSWAGQYLNELRTADPAMPEGVTDRAADCWEPLLAIADLAGPAFAEQVRREIRTIVDGRVAADQSMGVKLLADIKTVFGTADRMASKDLVAALVAMEEAPWGNLHGKPMEQRGLARRLKPYGIDSQNIRLGESVIKGYERTQLFDAWSRYLRHKEEPPKDPVPPGSATSATSATQIRIPVADVADVADPYGKGPEGGPGPDAVRHNGSPSPVRAVSYIGGWFLVYADGFQAHHMGFPTEAAARAWATEHDLQVTP